MLETMAQKSMMDGMEVEVHDFSESYKNPKLYAAKIASTSFDRTEDDIHNPDKLWEVLKTEANGRAGSVLEFVWSENNLILPKKYQHYENYSFSTNSHYKLETKFVNFRCIENIQLETGETFPIKEKQKKNPVLTFKLSLPIFVLRHIIRHRQASWMEVSRRRAESKFSFNIPNRILDFKDPFIEHLIKKTFEDCENAYNNLRDRGVPKELARMVIPPALNTTAWVQFRNPVCDESWFNFIYQRLDKKAQFETRELVAIMKELGENYLFNTFGESYMKDYNTEKNSYKKFMK